MKRMPIVVLVLMSIFAIAQSKPRVILHLQSADSLVHKSIVNQIGNLKKELPETEIELVCHGPGIEFLLNKNSTYAKRIDKLKLSHVTMVGCEFTMSQRNYKKEDLVSFAGTVPLGIAEIVKKQNAGWLYVKLGF